MNPRGARLKNNKKHFKETKFMYASGYKTDIISRPSQVIFLRYRERIYNDGGHSKVYKEQSRAFILSDDLRPAILCNKKFCSDHSSLPSD